MQNHLYFLLLIHENTNFNETCLHSPNYYFLSNIMAFLSFIMFNSKEREIYDACCQPTEFSLSNQINILKLETSYN